MPRRSTRIVEAASIKNDNLKVAQLYNPDISDDSDHDQVKEVKVKRQYRKRSKTQEDDIKSVSKKTKTNKNLTTVSLSPPTEVRVSLDTTNQRAVLMSRDQALPIRKNLSDDSEEDYVPPAKKASLAKTKRKPTKNFDGEPAVKKSKVVYEKLPNNNEDKDALEKITHVNKVDIKKEPGEEITRCRCVGCPELVKNKKIKTLLYTSSTDSNSNFIIKLKEILNPVTESPGEYVEEEDDTAKIKIEAVTLKTEPKAEPEDNDDNDPDDPSPISSRSPPPQNRAPAQVVAEKTNLVSNKNPTKIHSKPKVERMMNCLLCSNKDGKNLSGYDAVRHHVSVCLFSTGAYVPFLPHKQEQTDEIEEYGRQFRYKCQVENCEKNTSKSKAMGYREFSMHMGSNHGILERWAKDSDKDGAQELYNSLKNWRKEAGQTLPKNLNYAVEEVHTCLLCHGEGDGGKETKALSFAPEKINSTRYHYASCLFDFGDGVYLEKYKPHPENLDAEGKINDLLGKKFKYTCEDCPSKKSRRLSYKEFTTHMATDHGGLEEILMEHKDEKVRQLVDKLRKQ